MSSAPDIRQASGVVDERDSERDDSRVDRPSLFTPVSLRKHGNLARGAGE